jgi:hypothetical protein
MLNNVSEVRTASSIREIIVSLKAVLLHATEALGGEEI